MARAGERQPASMSLYRAIGPDEYSYASTRYSVVRIGVGERRKRGGREGLGARFGTVFSALPACEHIASYILLTSCEVCPSVHVEQQKGRG